MPSASDRSQHGVEHLVEVPPDVFSQEPQDPVAVLLEQQVLPAVTAIRLGIPEVLASVEFQSDAGIRAQQVDLQASLLSDYSDFVEITQDEVVRIKRDVHSFVVACREYLARLE